MDPTYGLPRPAIATTIMVKKQEMVSPQYGTPLYTEYDYDGLLLDVFGTFDGKDFDVMDVAITGTKFSVLKLVDSIRHGEDGERTLIEDMTAWCYREWEKEQESAERHMEEESH